MQNHKPGQRLIGLLLAIVVSVAPLLAQQRRNAAPKKPAPAAAPEPAPTFDSLLAAETYKVYCEVRGVGGLIRSPAVNDLLEPLVKLGKPPKEFKTALKWLNAHADILAGSRMMVAGWPARPGLPSVLIAIEFSSPEEAKKFYPELRDFLPTFLPTPTPTPTPSPSFSPSPSPETTATTPPLPVAPGPGARVEQRIIVNEPVQVPLLASQELKPVAEPQAPATLPYQMSQAGSLVLISPTSFTFRDLKPRDSKPLEEDQNFMLARNRFAAESLFLFVDLKSVEKEEKDRQKKWEEEEQQRIEAEAANPPKVEEKVAEAEMEAEGEVEELPPPENEPATSTEIVQPDSTTAGTATLSGEARGTDGGPMFVSLYSALFGGESKWPEAVAAALVFEGEAYVVRTLVINSVENKGNAIPFAPAFVSGPALAPESPNILPADIELFASASLDYPQIYEGMLKAFASAEAQARKYNPQPVKEGPPPETPFAIYEKKLGLKIKDDLLPLLGNEIAVALPKSTTKAVQAELTEQPEKNATTADAGQVNAKPAGPNPIVAISVKDREAVGKLIPKLIEGFGLKGANLLAQTERRDGTEITSYAGIFSYAFVGDFLVLSTDPAETRHVVDAYLNHQTLASDSHFRNFTRWQPRQVLGQVYVGPSLMETFNPFGGASPGSARMNDYLSRLSPLIEPTTYALTNDGAGPLHELHVPKNLVLWMMGATLGGFDGIPIQANESAAKSMLRSVHSAEATFEATAGNGRYATLDELSAANLISIEAIQRRGYRIEVSVSGNKFEAIAVPLEYGISGTLSYFIDETGNLRGGDHGGGPATAADQPVP